MTQERPTFVEMQASVQRERRPDLQRLAEQQARLGTDRVATLHAMNKLRVDIGNCVLDEFLNYAYRAGLDRTTLMNIVGASNTAQQRRIPVDFDIKEFLVYLQPLVDKVLSDGGVFLSNLKNHDRG